jgi:hypothetical protein
MGMETIGGIFGMDGDFWILLGGDQTCVMMVIFKGSWKGILNNLWLVSPRTPSQHIIEVRRLNYVAFHDAVSQVGKLMGTDVGGGDHGAGKDIVAGEWPSGV